MEFGKHIGKGVWAFADKALPAIYGIGFIFLVIRVLPENEYGAFVIIQTIFTIVNALGFSLAHQPLTKFAAETEENGSFIAVSLVLSFFYVVVTSALVLVFRGALVILLDPVGQSNLTHLFSYLPLLFLVSTYRSFGISLLQATYQVQKIFWIDAIYFIGTLVIVYIAQQFGRFYTASDLVLVIVAAQGLSSLVAVFMTRELMAVKLVLHGETFRKMWNFGKYTFGGNTFYTMFSQMDVFFVSSFMGILGVAVYNASKIFTRIFDMIAQVLQMFLIPYSSKTYTKDDNETMKTTAEKAICFSTVVIIPFVLIMIFFPEQLLNIFYNGKYNHGAAIVRIFGFLGLIVPWNAVAVSYIIGIGKVKQGFYFGVVLVLVAVVLYGIFTPKYGAPGTTLGYVIALSILTVVMVWFIKPIVPLNILNVLRRTQDVLVFVKNRFSSP